MIFQGDVLVSLYFISRGSIEIVKDDVVLAILGTYPPLFFSSSNSRLFNRHLLFVQTWFTSSDLWMDNLIGYILLKTLVWELSLMIEHSFRQGRCFWWKPVYVWYNRYSLLNMVFMINFKIIMISMIIIVIRMIIMMQENLPAMCVPWPTVIFIKLCGTTS